jgi:hypothetical protein
MENLLRKGAKVAFRRDAVLGNWQKMCYLLVTINEGCLKPCHSLRLGEGFFDDSEGA